MLSITRQSPLFGMLKTLEKFETSIRNQATAVSEDTDATIDRVKALQAKKQSQMEAYIASKQQEYQWSFYGSVSENIFDASKLLLGAYSWKNSGISLDSGLLLASGVTALANRVFKAIGLYGGTPEEKIASRLETGMQWFSNGLALVGLATSFGSEKAKNSTSSVLGMASGLTQGFMSTYNASVQKKSADQQADVQLTNAEISIQMRDLHVEGKTAERLVHVEGEITDTIKQIAETIHSKD